MDFTRYDRKVVMCTPPLYADIVRYGRKVVTCTPPYWLALQGWPERLGPLSPPLYEFVFLTRGVKNTFGDRENKTLCPGA